jgi:hypothetical protein
VFTPILELAKNDINYMHCFLQPANKRKTCMTKAESTATPLASPPKTAATKTTTRTPAAKKQARATAPARKVAAKRPAAAKKSAPASAAGPQAAVKPKVVAATAAPQLPANTATNDNKPAKDKKPKMVRDSVTIPKAEYAVLEAMKQRAAQLKVTVKKTELIRAGMKHLATLPDAVFLAAIAAVPSLKTGRPSKA